MEITKISTKEAISLIFIIIVNTFVFSTNEILVHSMTSASILNSIYISIIALILALILSLLFKKFENSDILDLSEFIGGKFLKIIIGILFFVYFTILTAIILKKVSDCLQIIYYPMTNIIYIILLYIFLTVLIFRFRKTGMFKANYIFSILLALSIILIFFGNAKNYDINNIFPIFGNGIRTTFLSGLSNLYAFSGLAYIYFLPANLQNPKDLKKISLISVSLTSILLIVTTANILLIYSHSLINIELFPLYLSVRYIEFGAFFQRLDSIFLSLCIIASILYLCITATLCMYIFRKTFNLSTSQPILYPSLMSIFTISMCIKKQEILNFFEDTLSKYMFFILILGIGIILLILANIKQLLKRGVKRE